MTLQSRTSPTASQPDRRRVVGGMLGLGAAALAAPLLTACGGERAPTPRR